MSAPATPADDPAAAPPERAIVLLDELAELGMELARAIKDQAIASPDPAAAAKPFAAVARAVRQTLMLRERLLKDRLKERAERRSRRKVQLEVAVECMADRESADEDHYERLVTEGAERLEREDDARLLDMPFDQAIAVLRHDLGLPAEPCLGDLAAAGEQASTRPQASGKLMPDEAWWRGMAPLSRPGPSYEDGG